MEKNSEAVKINEQEKNQQTAGLVNGRSPYVRKKSSFFFRKIKINKKTNGNSSSIIRYCNWYI